MNGESQLWMSRILYISAANYDRKHLQNSKIGLENSWIFFFQKSANPALAVMLWTRSTHISSCKLDSYIQYTHSNYTTRLMGSILSVYLYVFHNTTWQWTCKWNRTNKANTSYSCHILIKVLTSQSILNRLYRRRASQPISWLVQRISKQREKSRTIW